jgi:hypothetical protein
MKNLSDFDQLYKTTVSNLPKQERLWYCTRSLDKLQLMLIKNSSLMDIQLKENLREMIEATQEEIKRLEKLR